MHSFHDRQRCFPPGTIVDPSGKPLLSWRVALLPHIEGESLYRQFKLDEPWDSEHNKKLLRCMLGIYGIRGLNPKGGPDTHFQVFLGDGTLFEKGMLVSRDEIPDGCDKTIMVALAAKAVPWTKPEDPVFSPDGPMPELLFQNGVTDVLMCSGLIRELREDIATEELKALITRDGGENVNLDLYPSPR